MLAIDAEMVRPRMRATSVRVPMSSTALRARASAYEGGANTRRTARWQAPTVTANGGLLGNLSTLRDRSRAAVRNDGYAKGAIDKLVTNIIGTGIKPLSLADDPQFARDVQELFLRWTDESDADGLLDFYGQQAQSVRTWLEGGDSFIRLRQRQPADGLIVPLQLQVLEPELCPHAYTVWSADRKIRAGIEFDALGRRRFYHFHPSRPESDDFDASTLRRVPVDAVVHLYDPLRPGQLRGVPLLTQALIRLHELDKFDDALLLRQQLANMFVGFLSPSQTVAGAGLNPLTGQEIETSDDQAMLRLEPGIFQELNPGESVNFSDPPDAGQSYPEFMRQQLYAASTALGVPYETLTGDMSRVNDRTVRVILNEFRRRIMAWQHQVVAFQLCRRVWRAWMDRVFITGALAIPASYAADPEPWLRVKWMPQAWPYLHPVQDVQASTMAIRSGLDSRANAVSERGEDVEAIDAQQKADNDRAERLGLVHDSNAKYVSQAGLTQGRPPGTVVPGDETADAAPAAARGGAAA